MMTYQALDQKAGFGHVTIQDSRFPTTSPIFHSSSLFCFTVSLATGVSVWKRHEGHGVYDAFVEDKSGSSRRSWG